MSDQTNGNGSARHWARSPYHLTTTPFPASRKVYVHGHPAGVRVADARNRLDAHQIDRMGGHPLENEPLTVYDTSGPYTDPVVTIDCASGLAPLSTRPWILGRERC